jgi:phosphopantothenoylcysteine decarboxylase/phosphopantothenate--cysteine ligase
MGFEIAKAAANLGAEVVLISGPTHQIVMHSLIEVIAVTSASEMHEAAHKYFNSVDIAILSAAVADYKPKNVSDQKIKKAASTFSIELEKTKDILKSLGAIKNKQFLVGFALETNNELDNAKGKLKAKNLNLIVLNSLNDKGAGFGGSTNKVTFITDTEEVIEHQLKSKTEVAQDLMQQIIKQQYA